MNKPNLILVTLKIIILSLGTLTICAQDDHIRRELNKLIRYETTIRYDRTPGFIVAMIEKDTTFIFAFGQRAIDDSKPILPGDVFEIGGVSKLFTALMIERLAKENKLNLNQSINAYLDIPNPDLDSCTLIQLLTHTSGFPKYPAGWGSHEKETDNPFANYTAVDVKTFLDTYRGSPGQPYLYSHLNYVVLQWVLSKASGMEYESLLQGVVQPLHLQASTQSIPTVPGYGYDIKLKAPWTAQAYAGSIGVKTSLDDLILLCRGTLELKESFKNLLQPYPMFTGKIQGWVAKGWQVLPIPKNRYIYAHTGKTEGHSSFIGLLPETHTAVIVLSNSATGTDPLGLSILNMMNKNWKRK